MDTLYGISRKSNYSPIQLQDRVDHGTQAGSLLTDHAQRPDGWPASPKVVKPTIITVISDLAVDLILLSFSDLFLAFALTVRHYDQASISSNPRAFDLLSQATSIVFPILFACVVGRASHAILIWRLGRGEMIGTLDMLASSTLLTNTFTSQVKLRIFSILGIGLLALWTLSPFGGQACLRQMSTSEYATAHELPFAYFAPAGDLSYLEQASNGSKFSIIDGTFTSALLASAAIKASPRDPWGNFKVPKIEDYENTTVSDEDGWFDHDLNRTTNVYASLVGVPLAWVPVSVDPGLAMSVETAYLSLDCPIVGRSRGDVSVANYSYEGTGSWVSLPNANRARDFGDPTLEPLNFTYLDWGMTETSQCSLTTTYIEARVQCSSASACGVSRVRRSKLNHPAPGYTLLDTGWSKETFFKHFTGLMPGHVSQATPVQNYLIIPDNPVPEVMESENHIPTNDVFATRLGQLMNGYWSCLQGYTTIIAGITSNPDKSSERSYNTSSVSKGTYSTRDNVIQAHYAWVVILAVASMAMIIASLVSPLAMYFQKSPDLMLNISNLATRDSPFVALPVSGSFLGASDRARLVKDIRVRFGDVKADAVISAGWPSEHLICLVCRESCLFAEIGCTCKIVSRFSEGKQLAD